MAESYYQHTELLFHEISLQAGNAVLITVLLLNVKIMVRSS